MASLHEGFSDSEYEPVAQPFRGLRAFLIDSGAKSEHPAGLGRFTPNSLSPSVPGRPPLRLNDFAAGGGRAHGRSLRGSLRGVFMSDFVWGPDVNEAMCLGGSWFGAPYAGAGMYHPGVPTVHCDCGFWAYTTGEHFLSVTGPAAVGVVEGWGRMVVGPHGFRAQKARIVALAFPRPNVTPPPIDTTKRTGLGASLAKWLGIAEGRTTDGDPPPTPSLVRAAHPWELVTADLRDAVRAIYPVPVYDGVGAMLREHPLFGGAGLLDEGTA